MWWQNLRQGQFWRPGQNFGPGQFWGQKWGQANFEARPGQWGYATPGQVLEYAGLIGDVVEHCKVFFYTIFWSVFDYFIFESLFLSLAITGRVLPCSPRIWYISRISLGFYGYASRCFMMSIKSECKSSCAFSFHPINQFWLAWECAFTNKDFYCCRLTFRFRNSASC